MELCTYESRILYVVAFQNCRRDNEERQQIQFAINKAPINVQIIHANIRTWDFTQFPPICLWGKNGFALFAGIRTSILGGSMYACGHLKESEYSKTIVHNCLKHGAISSWFESGHNGLIRTTGPPSSNSEPQEGFKPESSHKVLDLTK